MMVLYTVTEFLVSFAELAIMYMVFAVVFKVWRRTIPSYMDVVLCVVGTGAVLLCNSVKLFSYFTLIFVAVFLSISALLLYRINFMIAFAVTSFYMLCLNCFDFLMLTFISNFYHGSRTLTNIISSMGLMRAIVIIIIKTLWVLAFFLIKKYLQRISVNNKGAFLTLVVSGVGACGFIFMADQTVKAFNHSMPVMWFVIICLLAAFVFIMYFMVISREEKIKLRFLEMRNNLLSENYNSINEIYMSNSKLYHDLNNHLNVLYQLIDDENVTMAKEYIKEISKPILSLSKTVWTGIDVVDVVINSKMHRMKELGIEAEINAEFLQNSNIRPNDLCTILSNLLDNAIEAVEKVKGSKRISLIIRSVNYFLFIRTVNPCEKVEKFEIFPSTTKENKMFHGWGLQSVVDVVEKYNGTVECVNEKDEFIVKVMLAFDKAKEGSQ